VEAPTEGSVLLAGLLLKLGGYGFIKILLNLFIDGSYYFKPFIYFLCAISIIISSFNAIVQTDFKKLIAYTSISHMNFIVMGIFSCNIYGLCGSIFLMLGHGIISSGLFSCVGIIYDRYHTRQIEYFSGLVFGMPIFSTLFFIILIGNFGFPLTCNFVGEFVILVSLVVKRSFLFYFIAGVGIFLSVIYSINLYNKLIFGNVKNFIYEIKDLTLLEYNALLSLVLINFSLGLFPNIIFDYCYFSCLYILEK
jgi:NADH-quinone oxidoreductase subunit M